MNKFRNIRFKLLIVALCSLILLTIQGLSVQPALAEQAAAPRAITFRGWPSPKCKMAAVSWSSPQKAFVFAIASDGTVWQKALNGSTLTWDPWVGLAAPPVTGRRFHCIGATSWAPGRIDIFGVDDANYAWHKYLDGTVWGPAGTWEALGKLPTNSSYVHADKVQVVSWGPDRVDAFVTLTDGKSSYHMFWDAYQGGWNGWWTPLQEGYQDLDSNITTWGVNRYDVIDILPDSRNVGHLYYTGTNWRPTPPEDLGKSSDSNGGVFSISRVDGGKKKLDVFTRDYFSGTIYYKGWGGSSWSGWSNLGGGAGANALVGDITGVSPKSNRMDIFEVRYGSAPGVYHRKYSAGSWYAWEYIGGEASLEYVVPTSWGSTRIDLFAIRFGDGSLWHLAWNGSTWTPSINGWEYIGN